MATWARGISALVMALALAGLLAAGCGGGGSAEGGMALGEGGGGGRLVLMTQRGEGLPRLLGVEGDEVHLQSSSQTQTLNVILLSGEVVAATRSVTIDPQASTQQIVLEELPLGTFQLVVEFVDSSGQAFAFFSTQVTLVAGQVTRVTLSPSSSPSSSPITGNVFVYTANFASGDISAFGFSSGSLFPRSAGDVTALASFPSGAGAHQLATSLDDRLLFVTHSTAQNVRSFVIDPNTGALSGGDVEPAGSSFGPEGIAVHPSLNVVYATAPSDGFIQWWSYNPTSGAMTPVSSIGDANNPEDITIHPNGSFAFASDINDNISTFGIAGGDLTGPPLNHGVINRVILRSVVVQRGANFFLYSSATGLANEVLKHDIDAGTGALSNDQVFTTGAGQPLGLAVHPTGNHLYVADRSGKIHVLNLDSSGIMTLNETEVVGPNAVEAVAVDPTGAFLLSTETVTGNPGILKVFSINPGGDITFTGVSQPTGQDPTDVIFATP